MFSLLKNLRTIRKVTEFVPKISKTTELFAYSSGAKSGDSSDTKGTDVLVENKSGVCVITLNRPNKYNAFNTDVYDGLTGALNKASADDSVKLGLITANGPYFSAGLDFHNYEELIQQSNGDVEAAANQFFKYFKAFTSALIDFPKPLIGAVNGPAYGIGLTSLALMDCVIASDTATFQAPFSSIGLVAEVCSSYTLPLIMGTSKASQVLYFNHKLTSNEALECGLVSRIVPSDQFKAHIDQWIFGSKGLVNTCYPKSMQFSKALVRNKEIRNKLHMVNKDEMKYLRQTLVSQDFLQSLKEFISRKQK